EERESKARVGSAVGGEHAAHDRDFVRVDGERLAERRTDNKLCRMVTAVDADQIHCLGRRRERGDCEGSCCDAGRGPAQELGTSDLLYATFRLRGEVRVHPASTASCTWAAASAGEMRSNISSLNAPASASSTVRSRSWR